MTRDIAEQAYDANVDEWLAACDRSAARGGDGYSSHNMDAMLSARDALTLANAELGIRMDTAAEVLAAIYAARDERFARIGWAR